MSRIDCLLEADLQRLERSGLRRRLSVVEPGAPGHAVIGGATLLNVSSNDYLGLARHPLLAARAAEWAARFGAGSGASRLICGTLPVHGAIETKLAALKGREDAMLLASGWQANTAVLGALLRFAGPDAILFSDALNHSSLVHGARLGRARVEVFRHNDMEDLAQRLRAHAGHQGRRFIATESVFSMDGDRADLPALRALSAEHDAFLYVDEAHATGVLGPRGMGLCARLPGIDLVMGTFSKALGSFGAYVTGSSVLIDWLRNACAGFVFTTAPPPPVLGAIDAALDLVPGMDRERAHLAAQSARLRAALAELGIDHGPSTTQIVPALIGDARQAVAIAATLRAQGVLATAIRPPTVPPGTSRIRFALSAAHGAADIDRLIATLRASWPERRPEAA